jgi:hypothetical protein
MPAHYFKVPFCDTGDKAAVPNESQPSGEVSYADGWPPDYEKDQITQPNEAKNVPRLETNQLNFNMTGAIKETQELLLLPYRADVDYPVGGYALATDGFLYRANIANGPSSSVVSPIGNPVTWEQSILGRFVGQSTGNVFEQTATGLGGHGYATTTPPLLASINNTALVTGFYRTDGSTTGSFPTTVTSIGNLIVRRTSASQFTEQYSPTNGASTARVFERIYNGASFTPWTEFLKVNGDSEIVCRGRASTRLNNLGSSIYAQSCSIGSFVNQTGGVRFTVSFSGFTTTNTNYSVQTTTGSQGTTPDMTSYVSNRTTSSFFISAIAVGSPTLETDFIVVAKKS